MHVHGLCARVGRQAYPVTSWPQVSTAYQRLVKHCHAYLGIVPPPCEIISLQGEVRYWVSRNGCIWHGRPGTIKPGTRPMFTPEVTA